MPDARVLIVDDEAPLRSTLRDAFEDMGFTVLTATSAEDALEMLLREQVDACTVDIRLPGISGNEFIHRAHTMRPALKFVIYTGSWNYELPSELASCGVSQEHIFRKPCLDLDEIASAIEKLTGSGN